MQQAYKLSRLYALLDKNRTPDSCFHIRLGSNFPIILDLFEKLYSTHPYKKEAFSPGYFLENASFYGYSPTLLLNANIKIFSNPTLTAIMTIVHANRSGVSRYTLALYNFSPMEPAGMPITSAAIPAFQQRPSPSLQAVTAYGITWER